MRPSSTITEATTRTKRLLAGLLIGAAVAIVVPSGALADEYELTSQRVELQPRLGSATLGVGCAPSYHLKWRWFQHGDHNDPFVIWNDLSSALATPGREKYDIAQGTYSLSYTNLDPLSSSYAQYRVICTTDAPPPG